MNTQELNIHARVNRIGIGALLILFTMLAPAGPLGWLAVLPLIGTLPIFAGMFGYDPVSEFVHREFTHLAQAVRHHYSDSHRPHHG